MYTFKAGDRVVYVYKLQNHTPYYGTFISAHSTDRARINWDYYPDINLCPDGFHIPALIPESVYKSKLYKAMK